MTGNELKKNIDKYSKKIIQQGHKASRRVFAEFIKKATGREKFESYSLNNLERRKDRAVDKDVADAVTKLINDELDLFAPEIIEDEITLLRKENKELEEKIKNLEKEIKKYTSRSVDSAEYL
jgi:low affinity Fe/Cu permease